MNQWGRLQRKPRYGGPVGPPPDLAWRPLSPDPAPTQVAKVDSSRLEHAIRCASEAAEPEDAIRRIDVLWQAIDALASLAESRMRMLLARVKGPDLAPEPRWLSAATKAL